MGILDRGERDKNNETGLKEGGGIEMSTNQCLRRRREIVIDLLLLKEFVMIWIKKRKKQHGRRIQQMGIVDILALEFWHWLSQ